MHILTIVHLIYLVSKSESGINSELRRISNLPLILVRIYCMRWLIVRQDCWGVTLNRLTPMWHMKLHCLVAQPFLCSSFPGQYIWTAYPNTLACKEHFNLLTISIYVFYCVFTSSVHSFELNACIRRVDAPPLLPSVPISVGIVQFPVRLPSTLQRPLFSHPAGNLVIPMFPFL